jgi:hypothetical protein
MPTFIMNPQQEYVKKMADMAQSRDVFGVQGIGSGLANTAFQQQPEKPPQIPSTIGLLASNLEGLEKEFEMLREKLSPLIAPIPEKDLPSQIQQSTGLCSVAASLNEVSQRICNLCNSIHSLREVIEL